MARRDKQMQQMILAGGSFGTGQRRGMKRYMADQITAPVKKERVEPLSMIEKAALRVVRREGEPGGILPHDLDGAPEDASPSVDPGAIAAAVQVQIVHQHQQQLIKKQEAAMEKVAEHKRGIPLSYVFLEKKSPGHTMREAKRYLNQVLEKDHDLSESFNELKRYLTIVKASIAISQGMAKMALHDLKEPQAVVGRVCESNCPTRSWKWV